MKYATILGSNQDKFDSEVMALLSKGWKCQGGVSVSETVDNGTNSMGDHYDNGSFTLAQAMTFDDTNDAIKSMFQKMTSK